MDEALKKFYYDLYDGETEGFKTDGQETQAESQSFNIDEYFDNVDTAANNNNDKHIQENNIFVPPSISDRSTIFPKPKQNHFSSTPAKPTPAPSAQQASVPAGSEGAREQARDQARDPTFVLSRLLFHLSQLPQL